MEETHFTRYQNLRSDLIDLIYLYNEQVMLR